MKISQQRSTKRIDFSNWRQASYLILLASVLAINTVAVADPASSSALAPTTESQRTIEQPPLTDNPLIQSSEQAMPSQPTAQHDLSILGMYQHADRVVKGVIIGLLLASVVTWALFFAKGASLYQLRRQLKKDRLTLQPVNQWPQLEPLSQSAQQKRSSLISLYQEAASEWQLSSGLDSIGIKERSEFRLQQWIASYTHRLSQGNSYLATVGAITPFIGLFGTVWGIMNSFIGIARSHTTNLAVVAPGIAEALLATAIGLVTAIPAVVIYNIFNRSIRNYRAQASALAGKLLLLQARALDQQAKSSRGVYPLPPLATTEKSSSTNQAKTTSQMQVG